MRPLATLACAELPVGQLAVKPLEDRFAPLVALPPRRISNAGDDCVPTMHFFDPLGTGERSQRCIGREQVGDEVGSRLVIRDTPARKQLDDLHAIGDVAEIMPLVSNDQPVEASGLCPPLLWRPSVGRRWSRELCQHADGCKRHTPPAIPSAQ